MAVFKQAYLFLKIHVKRNIFLASLLVPLFWGSMLLLTVYTATTLLIPTYEKKMSPVLTIVEPFERGVTEVALAKEKYLEIGNSSYVKDTQFSMQLVGTLDNVTLTNKESKLDVAFSVGSSLIDRDISEIVGLDMVALKKRISEQNCELTGSFPTKKNECVISQELAEKNNLSIGSVIYFTPMSDNLSQLTQETLTITGIFRQQTSTAFSGKIGGVTLGTNQVYVRPESLTAMSENNPVGYMSIAYYLTEKDAIEPFEKEVSKASISEIASISSNESFLTLWLTAVTNMKYMTGVFLIGLILLSIFLIILVTIKRTQKNNSEWLSLEIMGFSKKELIVSYTLEAIAIISILFVISFFLTKMTVQPFADWQLAQQNQLTGNIKQLLSTYLNDQVKIITNIPIRMTKAIFYKNLSLTAIYLVIILVVNVYGIKKFDVAKSLLERK